MKNKKAQAALEFLMVYGWAFLVVIIMISAIVYILGQQQSCNLCQDLNYTGWTDSKFCALECYCYENETNTRDVVHTKYDIVNALNVLDTISINCNEDWTSKWKIKFVYGNETKSIIIKELCNYYNETGKKK